MLSALNYLSSLDIGFADEGPAIDINAAAGRVWEQRRFRVTVEEVSDEEDEDIARIHDPDTVGVPVLDVGEDSDDEFEAISVWDQLAEALIRAGIVSGMPTCTIAMIEVPNSSMSIRP